MKTAKLTGAVLNWAVAKCEGEIWAGEWYENKTCRFKMSGAFVCLADGTLFTPSTDWAQGGPIIEREEICTLDKLDLGTWVAQLARAKTRDGVDGFRRYYRQTGPTPLIAAMRCFVASKLGDKVDMPEILTRD